MSILLAIPTVLAQTGTDQLPGTSTTPVVSGHAALPLSSPQIDWWALLPIIIMALGAVLMLTFTSLMKGKLPRGSYALYTAVVSAATIISIIPLWAQVQGWDRLLWWDLDTATTGPFTTFGSSCWGTDPHCGVVGIDGFSLAIMVIIAFAVMLGALLASDYLRREGIDGPELYVLLMLSGAGGMVMAVANDLIVLFLGLETLSIAVYVLAAIHAKKVQSQEAGLKYFVLGAFSSAFFLYGIAMVYGATATTNLVNIKALLSAHVFTPTSGQFAGLDITLNSPLLYLGIGLMIVGLGFKVAAVPFHFWSPDVYDGSPSPVVAYMASGVKAAGFAALIRVFVVGFESYEFGWRPIVAVLAALSMIVGAALAIVQTNVKRTLAYSSINHAGFILMAMAAGSDAGNSAVLFYLITYTFMVVGSFGIVSIVARKGDGRVTIDDYRGLAHSNPGLAAVFTVFLLAQAGVPFTSGFVAKLYSVIASVGSQGGTWLAIVAMVTSVVAAFLYLRIIISMYMSPTAEGVEPAPRIRVAPGARFALALCILVTVLVGIFPGLLTDLANEGKPALVDVANPTQPAPPPSTTPSSLPSGTGGVEIPQAAGTP